MAGNTRGKLKEHFEGVHRNLEWCIHHIAKSATLIENQLSNMTGFEEVKGNAEQEQEFFKQHPMYRAVIGLGEGLSTFDELCKDIYDKI